MNRINNFIPSKKILGTHFKINWKITLFFIIFWLIASIFILEIFSLGNSNSFIAKSEYQSGNTSGSSQDLGETLSEYIFSWIGIPFFGISSITLIALNFNKDISTGNISFWMTTSYSKHNVFLSKVLFVWLQSLIIFLPSFIAIFIIGLLAKDGNDYIGNIIYDSFSFILFILFLESLFILISTLLLEKSYLWIIISSLILVYVFITVTLNNLYKDSPEEFEWAKSVKFFSLDSLIVNSLQFFMPSYDDTKHFDPNTVRLIKIGDINYYCGLLKKTNIIWMSLNPFLNICLFLSLGYASSFIFNKKDLNI